MTNQPEALQIADELESSIHETHWNVQQAVDKLRRLHEVNQELVEALKEFLPNPAGDNTEDIARAALAKATGESNA